MAKKKAPSLPPVGDAYAFRLECGKFAVGRVVLGEESRANLRRMKVYSMSSGVLLAIANWFGDAPPDSDDPALKTILPKTHHSWKTRFLAWWSSPIPPHWVPIGKVPPSDSEQGMRSGDQFDWAELDRQVSMQWEWDHDREAALERDREDEEEQQKVAREWHAQERKRLKSLSLEQLSKRRYLSDWGDPIPAVAVRNARKLLRETAGKLSAMGEGATTRKKMAVLQGCIESLNELDAKHGFIDTTEREDLCDEFDLIVMACGLRRHKNLADRWRDW